MPPPGSRSLESNPCLCLQVEKAAASAASPTSPPSVSGTLGAAAAAACAYSVRREIIC